MNNNSSKFDLKSQILSNIEVAESHFRMEIACPEIAAVARPGQFIHLLIDQRHDPLLRRPFTIYRTKNGSIEILFQAIGRGTRLLSQKRQGDDVRIMGPLGNSFFIPDKMETAILVGGGIGIASLMMLAEELKQKGKRSIGLIGAQNCKRLLCVDEFQAAGAEVYVSTDDGSCGYRGLVTELLRQSLSNQRGKKARRQEGKEARRQRGKEARGQEGKNVSRITFHLSCFQ